MTSTEQQADQPHTKQSLLEDLAETGIPRDATVLIHSSMKSVGDVAGGADTVLDALSEYFAPGLLVLPTHTWADIVSEGDVFDPQTSPSCVGVLTELFRKRSDTVRSLHPTHSVAALGEDAGEFVAGEELVVTPCAREGVYGRLFDRDAYILFLGVPLTRNTFVHGVEEWNEIPNRLAKTPTAFVVKTPDGQEVVVPQFRHDAPIRDISENYDKLEKPLLDSGALHSERFGDAELLVTTARAVEKAASELLAQDPDVFLTPAT